MLNRVQNACVFLLVLSASAAVAGCDEECVDGYCEPVYDTGYYYDSLVSGLAYETKTEDGTVRTGVTGENDDPGSFSYYMADAEVSFSLGGTDLGTSTAKDKVTPFDVAGVAEEAVGGCNVDGTLPDDDFRIVHNIAVLLQTFDTDGDPTTDIEISADVAALFDGVSISFDQAWDDFQADSDLQGVLDSANEQSLFSETRTLVAREDALKALYEGIGLCPEQ
ncbi:MAG: hypothetical protein WCE62_19195 [Polyangiales bacterium]